MYKTHFAFYLLSFLTHIAANPTVLFHYHKIRIFEIQFVYYKFFFFL